MTRMKAMMSCGSDGWQPQAQLGDGLPCERGAACHQGPTIPKAFGLEAATRPTSGDFIAFERIIVFYFIGQGLVCGAHPTTLHPEL